MKLKIATVNFWDTAFQNDFLHYFIKSVTNDNYEFVTDIENCDVIFSSVFGKIKTKREKTIFYTGENIRPDFTKCAFSLSFDVDSWDSRNYYLPFWMSRILWPGFNYLQMRKMHTHGNETPIPINELIYPRNIDFEKSKFCAFFAGNPEVNRINLMRKINSYKTVSGYGLLFGNPFFDEKKKVLKDYKFTLCAENDYYPGYVTEKLFDAYSSGTVPIYFGGIPEGSPINKKAFINFNGNTDTLLQQIFALDNSDTLYNRIYREPLLTAQPEIESAIRFTRNCINNISNKSIL